MKPYDSLTDGEWCRPLMKGFRLGCCDCSLIHRINFRKLPRGIEFQVFRDEKETAAQRKLEKKKESK